jgi:hypothetical protein
MSATRVPEAKAAALDWQGFVAARYPGVGRHNMQALIAYGAYKRSRARSASEGEREGAGNGAVERAALHGWEDEGGSTL